MSNHSHDFPGMPDVFGDLMVSLLGAFLFVSIIGIPLLMLHEAAPKSRAARLTLRVIYGTLAVTAIIACVLIGAFLAMLQNA